MYDRPNPENPMYLCPISILKKQPSPREGGSAILPVVRDESIHLGLNAPARLQPY